MRRTTRKLLFIAGTLAVLLLFQPSSMVSAQSESNLESKIQTAKEQVYPALVNISVVVKTYRQGRSTRRVGGGSGVIVSPAGYVLTNYHVASDAVRIRCTLPNGEQIRSDVVGHDPMTDLSVLELRTSERENPNAPLPYATLGNSEKLQVGEYVLAMGNPLALSSSTTLGIVSNPDRVFTDQLGTEIQHRQLGDELTGLFTKWIQHDALILPGNSGGPLVNLEGEVVGINELGGQGMGFAIPSNLCSKVLNRILNSGEVQRGWAGLKVIPVGKLDRDTGVLVSSVRPESPAKEAGLKPGDVILTFDGEPVSVEFFEQVPLFYQKIADVTPGEEVSMTYLRNGEKHSVTVGIQNMRDHVGPESEFRSLGLTVRGITKPMAVNRQLPDTKGVEVTGVRPGSIADNAKPSLKTGDVLRKIDGTEIKDLDTFSSYLQKLESFDKLPVTFRRDRSIMVTVLELKEDGSGLGGGELGKPWLGIETQVLTNPVAKALGHPDETGFRVTRVYPNTKADKAGLKEGDLIVKFNDQDLKANRVQDAHELERKVENRMIGDTVTLTVIRTGEKQEIDVKLEETPNTAEDAETYSDEFFEFGVREITYMDRLENQWSDSFSGVIVTNVNQGSWAQLGGLNTDDVIRSVEEKRVSSPDDLKEILKDLKEKQPDQIRIRVRRGVDTHFVFIEPEWTSDSGKGEEEEK